MSLFIEAVFLPLAGGFVWRGLFYPSAPKSCVCMSFLLMLHLAKLSSIGDIEFIGGRILDERCSFLTLLSTKLSIFFHGDLSPWIVRDFRHIKFIFELD